MCERGMNLHIVSIGYRDARARGQIVKTLAQLGHGLIKVSMVSYLPQLQYFVPHPLQAYSLPIPSAPPLH